MLAEIIGILAAVRIDLVGTTANFRAFGPRRSLPINHLLCENRRTAGRIGEDGLTRKGGYAFDCWTPEEGLSRGYTYGRIEDARHARNFEIRSRKKGDSDHTIACSTVDDFVRLTI